MATGLVLGLLPNHLLLPALPETINWWSELDTAPTVARQLDNINRVSPEGSLMVTYLPSFAINWANVPALLAIMAPCPGRSSIQDITVPKGISASGSAFPISGAAPAPATIC